MVVTHNNDIVYPTKTCVSTISPNIIIIIINLHLGCLTLAASFSFRAKEDELWMVVTHNNDYVYPTKSFVSTITPNIIIIIINSHLGCLTLAVSISFWATGARIVDGSDS